MTFWQIFWPVGGMMVSLGFGILIWEHGHGVPTPRRIFATGCMLAIHWGPAVIAAWVMVRYVY